jgi:hypothetical protein
MKGQGGGFTMEKRFVGVAKSGSFAASSGVKKAGGV